MQLSDHGIWDICVYDAACAAGRARMRLHGTENIMKFYLAPLEGITGYIYRDALHEFFGEGVNKYFTPFLEPHIHKANLNHKELADIDPANNAGQVLIPQILANDAEQFLSMEAELREYGYEELNLNLGCPSKTVVSRHRGSALLAKDERERLERLLDGIYSGTKGRVSVKTRIGYEDADVFPELIEIFNRYPISELIIHPRTQTEYYRGKPHYEAFEYAARHAAVPLVYNGDVCSPEDYGRITGMFGGDTVAVGYGDAAAGTDGIAAGDGKIRSEAYAAAEGVKAESGTGAADGNEGTGSCRLSAVMIGRGAIGRPSLIRELAGGKHFEKAELEGFLEKLLMTYYVRYNGETPALHKMKEVWTYLITSFPGREKEFKRLQKTRRIEEYLAQVREILQ